jgi:hypothetical protein
VLKTTKNNQNLKLWKLPVGNANLEWKDGCELAVRIDGKPYFVDGTSLDSHGDAHANDGFCTAIRKASVIGEIKNNRFLVSQFKLLQKKRK